MASAQGKKLSILPAFFICTICTCITTAGFLQPQDSTFLETTDLGLPEFPAFNFHHPPSFAQQAKHPSIAFSKVETGVFAEDKEELISFTISWMPISETSDDESLLHNTAVSGFFLVTVTSEDSGILEVVNSPYQTCILYNEDGNNVTFVVKGVFLGYTKILASVKAAPGGCFYEFSDVQEEDPGTKAGHPEFSFPVTVIRLTSPIVDAVTILMVILIALNYINMGVQLSLQNVATVLKKPIGPCIGFICQFLFMPLASFGVGYLLFDDVSFRLGLFTLGCSPGGSMSNFWTLLFGGDLDLSITMTFISTFAALGMMPLWIFTLGRTLFRDRDATIPYLNLTGSLVMLTIPVGVGLLIRQYSPRLTKKSEAILKPLCLCVVVVGISFTLYVNRYVFYLFTWQIIIAGMSIAWGGYCFGALVAWMARLKRQQIIAVSIETALQNPGVAFVLLLLSLPQPEADLTLVPVIAQIMVTGFPMYLVLISLKIRSFFLSRSSKRAKNEEIDSDTLPNFSEKDYLPLQTYSEKPVIVPATACTK